MRKAKSTKFQPSSALRQFNILTKLVKGTDKLQKFSKFRYRPMTFVNMRFEGRGLLPDVVLWLPENKYPFFRLTEAHTFDAVARARRQNDDYG